MINVFGMRFLFNGKFSVSERGKEMSPGLYSSINLVEKDVEEINLDIDIKEEKLLTLSISDYHVENEDTKRCFHSNLECQLSREDALSIIEALSFAVKIKK